MTKQEVILQVIDCKDYADVASMIREANSVTVILRALEIAHRNGMKAAATGLTYEAQRIINHVNAAAELDKSLAS